MPLIFPNLTDIHLHGNPISTYMKSKLHEVLHGDVKGKGSSHILEVETDGYRPQSAQLQG